MSEPLFAVAGLSKHFPARGGGRITALVDASFAIAAGETLALVGESGCGKTTLARTASLLYRPDRGSVRLAGIELTALSRRALKPHRRAIQLVFQDPFGSLNPRLRVGSIVAEPLVIHGVGRARERRARAAHQLASLGLEAGDLERYPHEFSGGQRQRIAIARALVLEPKLLVADEPLSALDVSVQAQLLELLGDLRARLGLAMLFISHDLAAVDRIADRIAVMYLGRIVELAPRAELFARPSHPYTQALLAAVPRLGAGKRKPGTAPKGEVADPLAPPSGCPFHPRCPKAQAVCREREPPLEAKPGAAPTRRVACHFPD
ncbi:MAG TPA: oligopeptide/dipeptide ABC transporter ATP-binding protein [Alphaproteobacteria bacterium]|nr:oligopeptide/dipeptide ABC transporter ATP-binding protein [Alphaproteobacteria bacterium]